MLWNDRSLSIASNDRLKPILWLFSGRIWDVIQHAWLTSDSISFPGLFLPLSFDPSNKGYHKCFQIYLA